MATWQIVMVTVVLTIAGLLLTALFIEIGLNKRDKARRKGVYEVHLKDGTRIYWDRIRSVTYWDENLHKRDAYPQPEREVIHMCPPTGSGVMPCCGGSPLEHLFDRMTIDPKDVTCPGVTR